MKEEASQEGSAVHPDNWIKSSRANPLGLKAGCILRGKFFNIHCSKTRAGCYGCTTQKMAYT